MYKCRNCGNEEKFYGIVKEQGNALIFQNVKSTVEPVPERSLAAVAEGKPPSLHKEPQNTVRCNLWAIQNNGRDDGIDMGLCDIRRLLEGLSRGQVMCSMPFN